MTSRVPPPPPSGFVRVGMRVAYDGTPFHGFARNPGVTTVQGELERVLCEVLRHDVHLSCAGRTDAGVHARGQVVSFDADEGHFDPRALERALNRMLEPSIAVDRVAATSPDFDARLSCNGRTYRYHVLNRPIPDPLLHHLVWHVRDPLDLAAMELATDPILGSHDFTSFSKRNKSRRDETFEREIRAARWWRNGEMLRFEVTANAFTHQMVRSLVGMCVEIGRGRRRAVEMAEAIAARSRDGLPSPAPPRGLVLWRATYP